MNLLRSLAFRLVPGVALTLAAIVLSGALSACKPRDQGRAKVAVSVFPLFDLTRRIAGPDADVVLVVPVGRDPRSFAPAPSDVEAVRGARLGVMGGLGLDAWMEALAKGASEKARVLKVGDRVPTLASDPGGAVDPYFWLDPQRARIAVKAIGEDLARVDAPHASAHRKRAADLDAALEALDRELEQRTAGWKGKRFALEGTGLAYFADRYKLEGPDSAHPTASKVSPAALDLFGGGPGRDSYEAVVRHDVTALESAAGN